MDKKIWNRNSNFWHVDCREITKLHEMLQTLDIPHDFKNAFEVAEMGKHLCYPAFDLDKRVLSAITHIGSYGREEGLIEIMGLLTEAEQKHDSVVGWLTAEDVFERIWQHWTSCGKTEGKE